MIVCDNIIFELQKFGGVSKYWAKNIEQIDKSVLDVCFLEGSGTLNNYHRKQLSLSKKIIHEKSPTILKKFLIAPKFDSSIFHSSYYRISNRSEINIVTIHDFINELFPSRFSDKFLSFIKKNACIKADKIITVSNNTKKDLLNLFPSINPEKVTVIHNGVDEEFYPEQFSDYFKIENKLINPRSYFFFVGNRGYCKNFPYVLDIFSKSLNFNKNLQLIIVGGGSFTNKEKLLVKKYKISIDSIVKFEGIDTNNLRKLYSNALATLIPSLYEGFGIPALEAAKCKGLVIGSKGNSLEEIIGNSEFLINLSQENEIERILSLIFDESKSHLERARLHLRSNLFSWKHSSNNLIKFYSDLLK